MQERKLAFLLCGAQKCGTSSLDRELRQHPSLCLPAKKELHFFDDDALFARDPAPWAMLHAQFNHCELGQRCGEATPIYLYWPPALPRIKEYNPAIKLIVMLRNPFERCYSHWRMEFLRGAEALSFSAALYQEQLMRDAAAPQADRVRSYVARGLYASQLKRLWSFFPREQTHIIMSEEHWAAPVKSYQAVCRFLEIPSFQGLQPAHANQAVYGDGERAKLPTLPRWARNVLTEEIEALEDLLPLDCSQWKVD